MTHIIVKNYEHFNRSLPNWDTPKGKYIKSKSHYENELAKSGMRLEEKFGQVSKPKLKDYELSKKARDIIQSAKNSKGRDGKVRLGGRTIDAMKEIGAIAKKIPEYMKLPSHYSSGGFSK